MSTIIKQNSKITVKTVRKHFSNSVILKTREQYEVNSISTGMLRMLTDVMNGADGFVKQFLKGGN
jgi:hypothetical protein